MASKSLSKRRRLELHTSTHPKAVKARSIWIRVLPYLPPIDLISVSRCHPQLRSLVDQFFVSGTHISIDANFVRKLPIQRNEEGYRRIGEQKRSLTISNLSQAQTASLFKQKFGNITKLVLIDVKIFDKRLNVLPSTVQSLTLTNCSIHGKVLHGWLNQLQNTLQSIHVLRSRVTPWQSLANMSPELILLPSIRELAWEWDGTESGRKLYEFLHNSVPNVESLTLIMRSTEIWGDPKDLSFPPNATKIKRLDLDIDYTFLIPGMNYFAALEDLFIRNICASMWYQLRITSAPIKRFWCLNYEGRTRAFVFRTLQTWIRSWTKLEYLKLKCEWYEVEEIKQEFPNLSWILICCPPTSGYNLVHSLNEYCLQHIASYLSADEKVKLSKAHPSLKWVRKRPWFHLDSEIYDQYFHRLDRLIEDAKEAVQVEVGGLSDQPFYEVIGFFKNLKRLKLIYPTIKNSKMVTEIPLVDELIIQLRRPDSMEGKFYSALFKHFAPALKHLRVCGQVKCFTVLRPLTNLRSLTITAAASMLYLSEVLAKNEHLSFLHLTQAAKKSHMSVLAILKQANADALRHLILDIGVVPQKEMLKIAETVNRFRMLTRFSINMPDWDVKEEDIKLFTLKELNHLTLFSLEHEGVILTIVEHLPKLTKLTVNSQNYPSPALCATLRTYLEGQNRKLKFGRTNEGYVLDF